MGELLDVVSGEVRWQGSASRGSLPARGVWGGNYSYSLLDSPSTF